MFTNRRNSPRSSHSRSFRPGYCFSRSSTISLMFAPVTWTVSLSFVTFRNGVGIRTLTAIIVVLRFLLMFLVFQQGRKLRQARLDDPRLATFAANGFLRFQPVSRDAQHQGLVPLDATAF